jgi:hypothetical protein
MTLSATNRIAIVWLCVYVQNGWGQDCEGDGHGT